MKKYLIGMIAVVDDDNIYVLELLYAKGIPEEKLERLKNLVHDWNPK